MDQKISDYIALAETSYADFTGTNFSNKEKVDAAIIRANKSGGDKGNESDRTKSFAEYITKHYTVVAHYTDRLGTGFGEDGLGNIVRHSGESGFSATLFREGETGKESPQPAQIYPGHARHLGLQGRGGGYRRYRARRGGLRADYRYV